MTLKTNIRKCHKLNGNEQKISANLVKQKFILVISEKVGGDGLNGHSLSFVALGRPMYKLA